MNGRLTSILTIGTTIAGLVLMVVFWWADQESKDIKLNVVSKVALSPEIPGASSLIAVSVDGRAVEKAYISLVELTNAGTQPVISTDYEGPIGIGVGDAKLVQVSVVKSTPADLQPKVVSRGDALEISPLLLNPGDLVRISIVTDGAPIFSATARIAGIRAIQISDDIDARTTYRAWRNGLTAISLLALYSAMSYAFWTYHTREFRRGALLFGAITALFGVTGLLSIYEPAEKADVSIWLSILTFIIIALPLLIGGMFFVKTRRR